MIGLEWLAVVRQAPFREAARGDGLLDSTAQTNQADRQPLCEHLINGGTLAAEFAAAVGGPGLDQTAGQLHDLGKYTERFPRRRAGDPTR